MESYRRIRRPVQIAPQLAPLEPSGGGAGASVAAASPSRNGAMSAAEIRQAFVRFFEEHGHLHVPSSSLVPHNDPTVLLTTAGMQQMTPYFLGLEQPPSPRMVSVQKCFRTVDIDEVGDESHCTFFFMLGNFSVGDYFKHESLRWSWEFLTQTMGLPEERLYPTVHPTDEESLTIWVNEIGVPIERMTRLSDNWWGPVGDTGPNGPDSEIYFDLGPEFDDDSGTGPGDNPRYLEIWNNVFMEFFQRTDGTREPLPRKNVDTGMGLERLAMIMQGGRSIYDTDLYQPIIQRAAELAGEQYGENPEIDMALRIIADHSRGGTFLISDGVLPGNEGRSYVLRRILRRAIRAGRKIGLDRPFLAEMARIVIAEFSGEFPNLAERGPQIERVLEHEEVSFGRTLNAGIQRFNVLVDGLQERGETVIPGDEAFKLYDTYGFPYDLTVELAREHGFTVDEVGYQTAMAVQREASRSGAMFKDEARNRAELYVAAANGQKTEFLGYDPTVVTTDATIVALVGPQGHVETADAGQPVEVILDRTPFYAESGGQVGDTGTIRTPDGVIEVADTSRPAPDIIVHRGVVVEGYVRVGDLATARIDAERRQAVRRNHTATHLLHRALRQVLGTETHQAGSLVAPDRLRFDFTSLEPVTPEQLEDVAAIANRAVIADFPVETTITSYDQAVATGAMALFGEKYGDIVRLVQVDDFSRELCGGTHVQRTGEIGPIIITSEQSVAAGIRRIEAVTGEVALERIAAQQRLLDAAARDLRVTWDAVPSGITALRARTRELEREVERLRGELATAEVSELIKQATPIPGTTARLLAATVTVESRDDLRRIGDRLRDRIGSGVIVLGAVLNGEVALLAMVTPDLVKEGLRAGDLIREIAPLVGGRGGGRPDLAEAGGKDPTRLREALDAALPFVQKKITP